MKKIIPFLLMIFISLSAQNYRQVKIYLQNQNTLKDLMKAGMQFDSPYINKDKSASVFLNDDDFKILQQSGLKYEVLIENWQEHYDNRPALNNREIENFKDESKNVYGVEEFGFGSMGGYYTMNEVYQELDNMRDDYPQLITERFSIGQTLEGRDMWMVKISDNPDVDEDEPEVFINSLIHAREPAGMMTVMYYMFYLLENYGTDPEVTYLVDNREIYFMPIINVDGYEYNRSTNPSGGGMWRKNRRNNGSSYGIDLNRNFGYQWGYDDNGSSPDPYDETYRGTAGFSEPETYNIKLFCEDREIKTGLNYHTYGSYLIYPWGYITAETEDSLFFRQAGADMSSWNGYSYGVSGDLLYEVNGSSDDWMYGEQTTKNKMYTITPEAGNSSDGFWPAQNRIYPIAQENLRPNLYITWVAGGYSSVIAGTFSPEYANPGAQVQLAPVLKNKGLDVSEGLTATLTAVDGSVIVNQGSINLPAIPAGSSVSSTEKFIFTIPGSAEIGVPLEMVITTYSDGIFMAADTVEYIPGVPTILFADDNNDPSVLWNLQSAGSNNWAATTSSYFSAPSSYTESISGNYASNADTKMITKNQIDLTNVTTATLSFRTRWNIENEWDCGQVFISTNNGSNWIPLEGEYTKPGSGSGEQPTGEPVYDGVQNDWVLEEISLSDYIGMQVSLKFEFRADGYLEYDGWYVDDIKIYYYTGGSSNNACVDVDYNSGWNMLSVPVAPSDFQATSVFPDVSANVYAYNGSYSNTTELSIDQGYWVKFDQAGSVTICGEKPDDIITLTEGWNLIGSNEIVNSVSDITVAPAGIISSSFFGYNNGYTTADNIEPGKAYWVKTTSSGTITLNGIGAKKQNKEELPSGRIIITDAAGNSSTLYFTKNTGVYKAELPPLPPADVFDVRFNTGNYIESFTTTASVNLQGYKLPVKVSTAGTGISLALSNGEIIKLQDGMTKEFSSLPGDVLKIAGVSGDYDYQLEQNYPNPFNPVTTISFTLENKSVVTLDVYNTLGAKVATLANGTMEAGRYNINFNSAEFGLSSGVYIYKLSAGEFTSVKKMILLK